MGNRKKMTTRILSYSLVAAVVAAGGFALMHTDSARAASFPDPPKPAAQTSEKSATAVFAGGCFWGMQGIFEHVKGVTKTDVGYAGGTVKNPTYEMVESRKTGHA